MKKIISFLFLCVLTVSCFGQDLKEYGYIFSEFQKGIIRQKDGAPVEVKLNYDMIGQQVQYMDGEKMFSLQSGNILSVLVDKRKFVPAGNSTGVFYEEIKTGSGYLYVQHRMQIAQAGKNIGYGTSQTTSASNVASIESSGKLYSLNSAERMQGKDATLYYVETGGKYRPIVNVKNLTAVFKSNKAEIEKFAADNKTDFKKEADVVAIVGYAYSLNK